jgi:signal transduction histidine kinase
VQRIAELHGARLDLDDAPGSCGLQVRVRFPALVTPEDAGLSGRG